jgi:hypothetical protein
VWVARRRRVERPYVVHRASARSDALIAELATLDARFERGGPPDADARAVYERERADLKARIERALAEEKQPA